MTAIELTFPAGRYHATGWDHHVNEGLVEWPPSPWRLLRAFIATWHLKAREELSEETVRGLVDALSTSLPVYHLPSGAVSYHTRHYMPTKGSTTKVFDTFIHLPADATVIVGWPEVELDQGWKEALSLLCSRINYLGRAESWAGLRSVPSPPSKANTIPMAPGGVGAGQEVVRVLAPLPPSELPLWRRGALDMRLTQRLAAKRAKAAAKGKALPTKLAAKEEAAAEAELPKDVWDALQCDTGALRKAGWSQPPGSRWVEYARPRGLVDVSPPPARRRVSRGPRPTVARFALASAAPPRLTDGVLLAERIRSALLRNSNGGQVFVGRVEGAPMQGHQHAHILPESHGPFGHITHVTIYAPMGFDDAARRALDALRLLRRKSGNHLQMALLGVGQPDDFGGTNAAEGQCPLLARAKVWESRTPFVATRHPKRRSGGYQVDDEGLVVGSPEHDLRRLLAERGLLAVRSVEPIAGTMLGGKGVSWLSFRTARARGSGRRGGAPPCGYRVTFAETVQGPLVLGYGSHFGLGAMVPAGSESV